MRPNLIEYRSFLNASPTETIILFLPQKSDDRNVSKMLFYNKSKSQFVIIQQRFLNNL